jgi:hypothetical protein
MGKGGRKRMGPQRQRGRLFLWFERAALGAGMSVMAFVIERRLLRVLRAGGAKARPEADSPDAGRQAQLTASPHQVGHEPQR